MDSIFSWTRSAWSIPYSPLLNISGSTMGTIRALWQMLANLNKTKIYSKIHQRKYVTHYTTGTRCATTMFPNCFMQFPYANCLLLQFQIKYEFWIFIHIQQILSYLYHNCQKHIYVYIGFMTYLMKFIVQQTLEFFYELVPVAICIWVGTNIEMIKHLARTFAFVFIASWLGHRSEIEKTHLHLAKWQPSFLYRIQFSCKSSRPCVVFSPSVPKSGTRPRSTLTPATMFLWRSNSTNSTSFDVFW